MKPNASFQDDLCASEKPVIALLLFCGLVLAGVGPLLPDPEGALNLAPVILVTTGVVFLVDTWDSRVGRWLLISELVGLCWLLDGWLRVPGALALTVIPTALAAPLINPWATMAVALGQTVFLILLPGHHSIGTDLAVALGLVWALAGIVFMIYRPVLQIARWSFEQFQRAQRLLEEARNRQAELKQALEDLAYVNRQLALMNEKLAIARQVAEEAQKTKAAFVANVSHEFRTPLNMIIGLVDLLVETPEVYGESLPRALLKDLEIVRRNCEHLASMINDVLDLSQVEAGRLALHKERVNLAEVIQKASLVVRPLLDKKALGLQVNLPQDLPMVYCDRTRIRQVILNLMSNAARFTESGGITVDVAQDGQFVIVEVTDTGPGISPEDADKIFQPFHQGAGKSSRDQCGSGLGLSISKRFVELHGGRMWFKSQVGRGSTFSFKLPISPPIGPVARPERWIADGYVERAARTEAPLAKLEQRIVLCDETEEVGKLLKRYADGLEIVATRDLMQVKHELRKLPAQAVVFNTRFLEDLWPTMDKARQELLDIPILGFSLPPRTEHAILAGARGYLVKPVTRADLREAIATLGETVRRVLVVDDDSDALQLLTRMVQACDQTLQVLTASGGRDALEILRARRADLVLLDILMPDMDGWQVLATKAQEEAIRDIPVILVSAQDPRERPMESPLLMATMGQGLSISKLLTVLRQLSALLLHPGSQPGPGLEETVAV